MVHSHSELQSVLAISNTDYLKVPSYIKECSLLIFIYFSTPVISNYCYLKVNFMGPENLLCDISSLG